MRVSLIFSLIIGVITLLFLGKEVLRDNFLTKPNTIKIIGDQKLVVHLQKDKNFNLHRANSVLGILKKHSSLIGLFTSCTK